MKTSIERLGLNVTGGQIVARIAVDKNKGESGKKVGTIVAKTVKNGYLSHDDIVYNEYRSELDLKKVTKVGDVVIKLTQPLGACYIDLPDEGLVVSSFCAIINGFEGTKIDPRYLVAYLNSEQGFAQIASHMGGSTIQMISLASIKGMEIPLPTDRRRQEEIALEFEKKIRTEELANKLIILQQEKVNSLIATVEDE